MVTRRLLGTLAAAGAISAGVGALAVGSAQALWHQDTHTSFEAYRPASAMRLAVDSVAQPSSDNDFTSTASLIDAGVLEDLAADGKAFRLYQMDAATLGNAQLSPNIVFQGVGTITQEDYPMLSMARQRYTVVERGEQCGPKDTPQMDDPGMTPVSAAPDPTLGDEARSLIQRGQVRTILICQALVLPTDDGVRGKHENTATVRGTGTVGDDVVGEVSASDTWNAQITPKIYDWDTISATDRASIGESPGGVLGTVSFTLTPTLAPDDPNTFTPSPTLGPWAESDGGDGTPVTLPPIQSKGN